MSFTTPHRQPSWNVLLKLIRQKVGACHILVPSDIYFNTRLRPVYKFEHSVCFIAQSIYLRFLGHQFSYPFFYMAAHYADCYVVEGEERPIRRRNTSEISVAFFKYRNKEEAFPTQAFKRSNGIESCSATTCVERVAINV